nr:unnamed protein product [Callosobruchus chinensis]
MLGSPAGPGSATQRGLWPLAQAHAPPGQTTFAADSLGKYGVYSLFPGGPSFGSALYSHASIGRFSGQFQQSAGNTFHTAQKFSDSLFSAAAAAAAAGYTAFGAPTPPPGSPYSPVPVAQLELLAKGCFGAAGGAPVLQLQPAQQPQEYAAVSPKKGSRCDEKCCQGLVLLSSPTKPARYSSTGEPISTGCSRTNPLEWSPSAVKKEPASMTPGGVGACQVAEITTSGDALPGGAVKLEATSPTQKIQGDTVGMITGAGIPVGIAIARQRVQHQELIASPSLPPAGLLTTVGGAGSAQIKEVARIAEIIDAGVCSTSIGGSGVGGQSGNSGGGAMAAGGAPSGAGTTDDRLAGAWQVGGTNNTPTFWQYPAAATTSVPVEPMVPLPVPMPPVGFQLVRDPTTGGLLLLPTTGIESLQQAVVWPSYPQPSGVLLPSLPPIPPPPLQLLSSASSDYLSSSTTLHQHTQTHSTRLVAVTTDTKRKFPMPLPATTLIKIETDATLDQTKTLQAVSTVGNNNGGTVFADQSMAPLVTTHVIYQHPTNLILSQTPSAEATSCRSQATSPVTCLTPPPESHVQEEEHTTVQDASNQTDSPICSEDDATVHTLADVEDAKCKPMEEIEEEKLPEEEPMEERCDIMEPTTTTTVEQKTIENEEVVDSSVVEEEPATTEEPKPLMTKDDKEVDDSPKPDLSGLELLSNSIVQFESCRTSIDEDPDVSTSSQEDSSSVLNTSEETLVQSKPQQLEDSFGGLDLLCALAEQRIMEENEKPKDKERSKERKREKRKSKKHSSDEPKRKKLKSSKHHDREDREQRKRRKERHSSDKGSESDREKKVCTCQESYKKYQTPKSEEEVKKFLASKSQPMCCKGEWPCMNAMELDMRIKLAELQREYREKTKELSKLKPKRHSSDCKKRSRKKSTHSTHSERSLTPPPLLDKMDIPVKAKKDISELLKPPTLCAIPKLEEVCNINQSDTDTTPEKHSSSKKRKVGRPKKVMSSSGEHVATETIVAKKPKTSFVGYLLAAKEKLKLQNKTYPDATPPRYLEETVTVKPKKTKNNNTIIINDSKMSKMRPKLKAEATIKSHADEEQNDWDTVDEDEDSVDHIEQDMEIEEDMVKDTKVVENKVHQINGLGEIITHKEEEATQGLEEPKPVIEEEEKPEDKCTLTSQLLEVDKLRVLTAMGGLFYAGHLNAVEPPDVYSITLDGERGNRPHIMSREEILRDAIVEVSAPSPAALPAGTRVCAYWSQQYRCLYPGTVAEPGTPDPHLDARFVAVEFDDGDSGRIAIEDIRLLPKDYPIIEYDPNPLLSLCKRRRRTSTSVSTEEKCPKQTPHVTVTIPAQPPLPLSVPIIEQENIKNKDANKPVDSYKEKKRLKKKKKEKLKQKMMNEVKKKKKRHRCTCMDENCKHKRHHKKHRKHKRHHEKRQERLIEEVGDQVVTIGDDDVEEGETLEEKDLGVIDEIREEDEGVGEEYEVDICNPDDEVTMDDIIKATGKTKTSKKRDRQESCESRSKMSAFLPARQMWGWAGKGYKRQRAKGRSKKSFYKSIQRGKEMITVGDSAVFLSTGRPDRPYIGRIEAMWELCGTMVVRVKWFYHPEETVGCPANLQYPGALFESPHVDENDVQTISHRCEVLPLSDYLQRLGDDPRRLATIYDDNDVYYLAGRYDPTTYVIRMEPGIPFDGTTD